MPTPEQRARDANTDTKRKVIPWEFGSTGSTLSFVTEAQFHAYLLDLAQNAGMGMTEAQAGGWAEAPLQIFREVLGERNSIAMSPRRQRHVTMLLESAARAHSFMLSDLGHKFPGGRDHDLRGLQLSARTDHNHPR